MTGHYMLERAKAVLAKEGLTSDEIRERFGVSRTTARQWVHRYGKVAPVGLLNLRSRRRVRP